MSADSDIDEKNRQITNGFESAIKNYNEASGKEIGFKFFGDPSQGVSIYNKKTGVEVDKDLTKFIMWDANRRGTPSTVKEMEQGQAVAEKFL